MAAVANHLRADGWTMMRLALATQHGGDVLAHRGDERLRRSGDSRRLEAAEAESVKPRTLGPTLLEASPSRARAAHATVIHASSRASLQLIRRCQASAARLRRAGCLARVRRGEERSSARVIGPGGR